MTNETLKWLEATKDMISDALTMNRKAEEPIIKRQMTEQVEHALGVAINFCRELVKAISIIEFQAKQIEDTLRIVERVLKSKTRETSLDRDVMQSWEMIKNVLAGDIDKRVPR